jgi:hypothetical protein
MCVQLHCLASLCLAVWLCGCVLLCRVLQTVSVFIYPTVGDFLQVDALGKRFVLAGEYTVQFGVPETRELGQGFANALLHAV